MIVRIADQDVELDDLIFQLQRKLPTGQVIHDEIGVSWEVIAENVYFCSRNEIGKYAKHLPRTYYEMLLPDHMEQVKGRQFGRGEGVVLLQGSTLRYIKVPTVRDENRMRQTCLEALSRE